MFCPNSDVLIRNLWEGGILEVHPAMVLCVLSASARLSLQPTSTPIRSWVGERRPSRSAPWRRDTWTGSSCTREPRGWSSWRRGTIRWVWNLLLNVSRCSWFYLLYCRSMGLMQFIVFWKLDEFSQICVFTNIKNLHWIVIFERKKKPINNLTEL